MSAEGLGKRLAVLPAKEVTPSVVMNSRSVLHEVAALVGQANESSSMAHAPTKAFFRTSNSNPGIGNLKTVISGGSEKLTGNSNDQSEGTDTPSINPIMKISELLDKKVTFRFSPNLPSIGIIKIISEEQGQACVVWGEQTNNFIWVSFEVLQAYNPELFNLLSFEA